MKLAVVSSFPPSTNALSSFGFFAIERFLESASIEEILVVADTVPYPVPKHPSRKLHVKRVWTPNNILSLFSIPFTLLRYQPDVIWFNFQYTLFGTNHICILFGLILVTVLRTLRFRTVLVLHHYLRVVNLDAMNIRVHGVRKQLMRSIDSLGMKSLSRADQVFVMVQEYASDFSSRFPGTKVEFVDQDLFPIVPFRPLPQGSRTIVTIGSYGTYKRLEILLDAFTIVREVMPDAQLVIIGQSHPLRPDYLNHLANKFSHLAGNLLFTGYVPDADLAIWITESNVVVVTNETSTGSSGVVRHAARLGRGVIAPKVKEYRSMHEAGWGLILYTAQSREALAEAILSVLSDSRTQLLIAWKNYEKAQQCKDTFIRHHLSAFNRLSTRSVRLAQCDSPSDSESASTSTTR